MIFPHFVESKLVLDSLTDHVLEFVNITQVNSTAANLLNTALTASVNNDWHDQGLLTKLVLSLNWLRPAHRLIVGHPVEVHKTSLVNLN